MTDDTTKTDLGTDDKKAAATAGAGDAADVNTDNADQKTDGGDPAPIYRPQGLPDHLAGKDDKETIDRLFKAVNGFRKDQAKGRGVPEKIDDYTIEFKPEVADKIIRTNDDGKDPVFEAMRGAFFEEGIPGDVAARLIEKYTTMLPDPASGGDAGADINYTTFGGADKAKPLVEGSLVFLEGLKQSGKISGDTASELGLLAYHGEGLKALQEIRVLLGDKAIPATLSAPAESKGITKDDIDSRVADPRYRKGSGEFDQVFYQETVEMFKKFYGTEKN